MLKIKPDGDATKNCSKCGSETEYSMEIENLPRYCEQCGNKLIWKELKNKNRK